MNSRTKKEMEDLLSDPAILSKAQQLRKDSADANVNKVLDIIIKTCQCYTMAPSAKELREGTAQLESKLEMARNQMTTLGYTDPLTQKFVEKSSVGLRNLLSTSPEESIRQSAYESLCSIGPFVLDHGFCEIIKQRNQLAKSLGFVDYYDYKVQNAEGFNKTTLFQMLDGLEFGTRPIMVQARAEFAQRYGQDALQAWNMPFMVRV